MFVYYFSLGSRGPATVFFYIYLFCTRPRSGDGDTGENGGSEREDGSYVNFLRFNAATEPRLAEPYRTDVSRGVVPPDRHAFRTDRRNHRRYRCNVRTKRTLQVVRRVL